MALSNMLKEPRREITETVVGLLTVAGPATALVLVAMYATRRLVPNPDVADYFLVAVGILVAIFVAGFLFVGLSAAVHAIGENVCEALDNRGLKLRPDRWDVYREEKGPYRSPEKITVLEGPLAKVEAKVRALAEATGGEYLWKLRHKDTDKTIRINREEVAA